jgi:4-carboxymuconolactone decarboxylase
MESGAAFSEARRSNLGAGQSPLRLAGIAPTGSGGRILVTGAHFHSAYGLYTHVLVAEARGLSDEKIATVVAGQRPSDLSREETVTYDVASALVSGSVLPDLVYRQAMATFGQDGAAEVIYLVGLYCLVSVTLNGFDVPVPESNRGKKIRTCH